MARCYKCGASDTAMKCICEKCINENVIDKVIEIIDECTHEPKFTTTATSRPNDSVTYISAPKMTGPFRVTSQWQTQDMIEEIKEKIRGIK